jgi:hypothetical protein
MDKADFDSIDGIAENSGRWPSARPSLAEFWEHALQALKRAVEGGEIIARWATGETGPSTEG